VAYASGTVQNTCDDIFVSGRVPPAKHAAHSPLAHASPWRNPTPRGRGHATAACSASLDPHIPSMPANLPLASPQLPLPLLSSTDGDGLAGPGRHRAPQRVE
jgi:hypothetical protein